MTSTRREFLRTTVPLAAAAVAAPWALTSPTPVAACSEDLSGRDLACARIVDTPSGGEPAFEPWWVQVHLPTRIWPTPGELDNALGRAEFGQYFRVQEPQDGPRLRVWDPRTDQLVYIGAEALGPVPAPPWAKLLNGIDGRWIDVSLRSPRRATAMQGDIPVRSALVITGMPGYETPTGYHQILRRVYNETMDSRTIPGMRVRYRYENVLYTQYFTGDGAAIHYNYWSGGFGGSGSRGCLGMTLGDSKFFWDWADVGVPLVVHA